MDRPLKSMGILSILPRPNNWHSTEKKQSKNGRMKEAKKGLGHTNAYYQAEQSTQLCHMSDFVCLQKYEAFLDFNFLSDFIVRH